MIELRPSWFQALLPALRRLPINHLFARSVLERRMDGRVWLGRGEEATLCHVVHPYGMSLLFGNLERADVHELEAHLWELILQGQPIWLQAFPGNLALEVELHFERHAMPVQRHVRANFWFDPVAYLARRARVVLPRGVTLRPLRPEDFALPDITVSPHMFWRNATQFQAHGGGWAVEKDGDLAAMAFASFRFDDQLEIGVETRAAHRRQGLAYHAASALVEMCLAAGLEPVWSCRKGNAGSYRLAEALGFIPTIEIPYYRLWAASG